MMKTTSTGTHALCLFIGFFLSQIDRDKEKDDKISKIFNTTAPIIPLKRYHVPIKEKNSLKDLEEITLVESEKGQPVCYVEHDLAIVIHRHPFWVQVPMKDLKTWSETLQKKGMIIPKKFRKNLPKCEKEKISIRWSSLTFRSDKQHVGEITPVNNAALPPDLGMFDSTSNQKRLNFDSIA